MNQTAAEENEHKRTDRFGKAFWDNVGVLI